MGRGRNHRSQKRCHNNTMSRNIGVRHVIPSAWCRHLAGVQCCMGITPLLGRYRRTLAGSRVNMRVSRGVSVVDRVPIAECDLMADNGVVHVVERVLPSATRALSGRRRHRLGQTLGHHLHRWWQLPSDIRRWFNN